MNHPSVWPWTLAAAVLSSASTRADQLPPECAEIQHVVPFLIAPTDQATGVPTNAVISVGNAWDPNELGVPGVELRTLDDRPVDATLVDSSGFSSQTTEVVPAGHALSPQTDYAVFALPTDATLGAPLLRIGSFRTGDGPLESSPAPPRIDVQSVGPQHCNVDAPYPGLFCCQDFFLKIATVTASIGTGTLSLTANGVVLAGAPSQVRIIMNCSFTDWPPWAFVRDDKIWMLVQLGDPTRKVGTLSVTARDLAGHESAPTELALDIDCTPRPDAGVPDAPPPPADAPPPAAAASADAPSRGCNLAPPGRPSWLVLVAVAAAFLRRRRR